MKPERRRVGLWDWIGNRIAIEVKPPRYFPKPPGPIRSWFLRGRQRRGQSYREMALIAVATFGGLIGVMYLAQLAIGHIPFGGKPLAAQQGLIAIGLCAVAIVLAPRRRMTVVCIPALLLALSFWAWVLHPGEPVFLKMMVGCVIAVTALIKLWGWNLDQ